jgi:hypothetical protein
LGCDGFFRIAVASDACAQISSTYAKWLEADREELPSSSELHETFSQTLSLDDTSSNAPEDEEEELTIMERTTEKTKVQSDSRMKEMLMEIQKAIVPKYVQIPLVSTMRELLIKSYPYREILIFG